jgi:hypothetical protein
MIVAALLARDMDKLPGAILAGKLSGSMQIK